MYVGLVVMEADRQAPGCLLAVSQSTAVLTRDCDDDEQLILRYSTRNSWLDKRGVRDGGSAECRCAEPNLTLFNSAVSFDLRGTVRWRI